VLTPEERKEKNRNEAAIRKAVAKADREMAAEKEDRATIDKHAGEIYEKCEKALENLSGKKNTSVWVDCKYKKLKAIEEVSALYKQSKYNVEQKFGDYSEERSGPRWYLVFS
jgi:hypothetical protein